MNALRCRMCGREFSAGEQFCSQDGTRLAHGVHHDENLTTQLESELAQLDVEAASAVAAESADFSDPPALVASGDPLVGTTLDSRYRILRVIGEGGMGVVYEALHVLIEKHVAIKVLRDTFTGRVDVVERFRQEAKSASKIGHPNIVDVSDFGETPSGQSYIVMEMLIGEDLADVLARERALSPTRAVRIAYQIARALHATHKKNIVHRDLKPENIYLVERDGASDVVKIVDFGVAKMNDVEVRPGRRLTRTGMLFGTPEYMSPEQALGKPFDHRVDIYALGAILFELVAGRVPFIGENFMEILAHHGRTPLPSLRTVNKHVQVSAELEAVIARALSKEPEGRHPSMGTFADELRTVPEMLGASATDIAIPGEWPSLAGSVVSYEVYGPRPPVPRPPPPPPYLAGQVSQISQVSQVADKLAVQAYEQRYQAQRPEHEPDQTPFTVLVGGDREPKRAGAARAALSNAQRTRLGARDVSARGEASERALLDADEADHDLDLSLDDAAHEAVLLSPGAELRSSAKLGVGLVVLASALLGVFILQRSHTTLRSLPSVHSAAASTELPSGVAPPPSLPDPERARPVELEQATQAATAAPADGVYADSLPSPTIPTSMQRTVDGRPASDGQPLRPESTIGGGHARTEATRHGSTTSFARSEAGLEASVEVSVRTVPRGASVAVLGTEARCEPTPCVLLVPKDRAVTLRAEARNTSVQKTFTFGEESEVELRLSGRKSSASNASDANGSTNGNASGVDGEATPVPTKPVQLPHAPSDLKVPSIFRDR